MPAGVLSLIFRGLGVAFVALLPFGAAAELVCDQPAFSFGPVNAATGIVMHVFALRNEGGQPLLLDEVASPCGCISARLATNRLERGASTPLPVTLDLRRRNGAQRLAVHVCYHTPGAEDAAILSLTLQGVVAGTGVVAVAADDAGTRTDEARPGSSSARPVVVELFGEAGCEACATVRRELLPEARRLLGGARADC